MTETTYDAATVNARIDIVIDAIEWLLANPDKKTFIFFARDASDKGISPFSPAAESFCLLGRITRDAFPLANDMETLGLLPWPIIKDACYDAARDFLEPIGIPLRDYYAANDDDRLEELRVRVRKSRLTDRNICPIPG